MKDDRKEVHGAKVLLGANASENRLLTDRLLISYPGLR